MPKINLILFIFLTIQHNALLVKSHGYMIVPAQRGSMWRAGFNTTINYNDMSNYCGGIKRQWDQNNGKCGVCGDAADQDPKDHEPGGKYASGLISKVYKQGEEIEVIVTITANHYGYFEFRLCENNDIQKIVDQECFDKNLLKVLNNNEETLTVDQLLILDKNLNQFRYFLPTKTTQNFTAKLKLPDGISCRACVLQWKYHAGNNYGKSEKADMGCLGCIERQEEFFNCADIAILNRDGVSDIPDEKTKSNNSILDSIIKIFKNSGQSSYDILKAKYILYFYLFSSILYQLCFEI